MRGARTPVIGLMVLALGVLHRCPPASAEDRPPALKQWELKAVRIGSDEKDATRKLNEVASEGWQYVGPLGNGLVAFRRAYVAKEQIIVEVSCNPPAVAPGERTTITVTVRAGDRSLLPGAKVTVGAGGGKFLPKAGAAFDPKDRLHGPYSASGTSDDKGRFTTWWVVNPAAAGYGLSATASKEGYRSGKAEYAIRIK